MSTETQILTVTDEPLKIYEIIERAELQLRERKLDEATKAYEMSLASIKHFNSENDGPAAIPNVKEAINLLEKDICRRIRDIERLNKLNTQQKVLDNDGARIPYEPMLASRLELFKSNLFNLFKEKTNPRTGVSWSDIEVLFSQEVSQLFASIAVMDQQRYRESDLKIEQLSKENKKLTAHIAKLKERWDSLVESARQKRNQQHE